MHVKARWLILLGCLGLVLVGWLVWAVWHTEPPAPAVIAADLVAVIGLAVGPWLVLVGRQLIRSLPAESGAGPVFARAMVGAAVVGAGGPVLAVTIVEPQYAPLLVLVSIVAAVVLALVGGILLPWLFLLTRTITRERAARVRAEERAEISAHLHDSVLQALTLIQKRTDEQEVRRLARATERELRTWLYGGVSARDNDFAAGVASVAEEIEDNYAVLVDLVSVGTCPLDGPASAVVGAIREALTNSAKHAGVRQVSAFVEVADVELLALVRDRGCGFDPSVHNGHDRRGIAESIERRMRQHGGSAAIRSAPGAGTEVELRMPHAGGRGE